MGGQDDRQFFYLNPLSGIITTKKFLKDTKQKEFRVSGQHAATDPTTGVHYYTILMILYIHVVDVIHNVNFVSSLSILQGKRGVHVVVMTDYSLNNM